MDIDKELNELFDDLEKNAYNRKYHTYEYKLANQIIREHFEKLQQQASEEYMPIVAHVVIKTKQAENQLEKILNKNLYIDYTQSLSSYLKREKRNA